MKKIKIYEFMSDIKAVENWLLSEKEILEKKDGSLSYWFHKKGVGLVIYCRGEAGEFHAFKDGTVTFDVEERKNRPTYIYFYLLTRHYISLEH